METTMAPNPLMFYGSVKFQRFGDIHGLRTFKNYPSATLTKSLYPFALLCVLCFDLPFAWLCFA